MVEAVDLLEATDLPEAVVLPEEVGPLEAEDLQGGQRQAAAAAEDILRTHRLVHMALRAEAVRLTVAAIRQEAGEGLCRTDRHTLRSTFIIGM